MKKLIILLFPFLIATYLLGFEADISPLSGQKDTIDQIMPAESHQQVQQVTVAILDRFHYRKADINDSLSSVIFDRYLQQLDQNKLYFLQNDIDRFEKHRHKFDDYLQQGELEPAFDMFNAFREKFFERNQHVYSLLDKGFDFTVEESLQSDRSEEPWPATKAEAEEIWRKIVKDQALSLKLTGKEWPEIAEILSKRYKNLEKTMTQVESEDVFQMYMNAFAESFDPHTNYFSPKTSENFKISMSQSLEGIGARLQMENDYVKVMEVIAGGPAFKSKLLHSGDRITGVAQGEDGEMVDVVGWRLDDVVQLIRGPKGSVVRLLILPAELGVNAAPIEIELVRDKVKLEDQAPRKEVLSIRDENNKRYKIGVISVPQFYVNFEEMQRGVADYNSVTRDVKKLILELEQEGIDGLIVDLRLNGGGSLTEAINLTGLFIPEGPVVQVRNANGSVEVATDPDPAFVYEGPLAVLVNRFSASASEIFAGAIQDYNRGIVIGEQTFGKGTVQNLLNLNEYLSSDEDDNFGQLKITLAKFYRITGSSTQNRGVAPDISLPSTFDVNEFGESSQPNSLPWDKISATRFEAMNYVSEEMIDRLKKNHQRRMKDDEDFIELINNIEEMKEERNKTTVSLQETQRMKERKEAEANKETRLKLVGSVGDLELQESENGETEITDAYLKEGVNIMVDMIRFRIG